MKTRLMLPAAIFGIAAVLLALQSRPQRNPRPAAASGNIVRAYSWRDFGRIQRKCRIEIPRADLAASEAEFGADPEDMQPQEISVRRQITYTSEQARDPKVMEKLRQKAQAEVEAEARAAVDARRKKLTSRGMFLRDENTVVVDVARLWQWNRKRIAPQVRRLAAGVGPGESLTDALLAFVQEIPYRKPADRRAGRITLGLLPPLEALAAGYGDCDTKSLLFASLADNGKGPEVILLRGPNHMIAGLQCGQKEEGVKVKAFGKLFLACECSHGVWRPGQIAPEIKRDLAANQYEPIRVRGGM